MSGLDILKRSDAGYYLMNEEILVGPVCDLKRLKKYYERNVEFYGELSIIKLEADRSYNYIKKEEFFDVL